MKYNTLLLDSERTEFADWERKLQAAAPECFATKIQRANVQQAWMLAAMCTLGYAHPTHQSICVGSHADTAFLAFQASGANCIGIDPADGTPKLSEYVEQNPEKKNHFSMVFATSVIEHDDDDYQFVRHCWHLLRPGGHFLFTTDFKPNTYPGDHIRGGNKRFYNADMIEKLLTTEAPGFEYVDVPDWTGAPDFHHAGHNYAFAAVSVRKA